MSRRIEKIASSIQRELSVFLTQMELPSLTTISRVEVAPDLKTGKVWVTIFELSKEKEILKILNGNIVEITAHLNSRLHTHHIPKVTFIVDYSEEHAARINALLKEATKEE